MNPRVQAIITAQNQTKSGFDAAVKDANTAATGIQAAGSRASNAVVRQGGAMTALTKSTAQAANQQRNLVFQLNDVAVSLAGGANPLLVFAQQGSQIATIYGPDEGGLGRALKETGGLAVGFVTKLWPIAAAVAAAGVAMGGLTAEVNKASDVQVSFGDVALAVWQEFSEGIYNFVKPAIDGIVGWIGGIWDAVQPSIVALGNNIVGTFVFAADAAQIAWALLPGAMGDITIQTANAVIDGVESMINGSISLINDFTRGARDALGAIGIDVTDIGGVDFASVDNPFSGYAEDIKSDIASAASSIGEVDYLGGIFGSLVGRAEDNALKRLAEDSKGATKELEPLSLGLKDANDKAKDLASTMATDLTSGIMSIWQTFRSGGNVLEAISNQLMNFADQLLSSTITNFFTSLLGGGGMMSNPLNRPGNFSIGNLATYAGGTSFHPGGMAIVGERGPELVSLPRGSAVATATETSAMLGGSGGVSRILVEISPALVGQILQQAANQSLELIKTHAPGAVAQANRNRMG